MRTIDAVKLLINQNLEDQYVYTTSELKVLFDEDGNALTKTIQRLVAEGFLKRAVRGVYVYTLSGRYIEPIGGKIASKLRPGELIYESFISAGFRWSLISQCPWTYTLATTGKSGFYPTSYGSISFTHVDREDIEESDLIDRSDTGELPLATPRRTYLDILKHDQSSLYMLNEEYNKYHGGWDGPLHHVAIEDDDTWDFLDNDPDLPKPIVYTERPARSWIEIYASRNQRNRK